MMTSIRNRSGVGGSNGSIILNHKKRQRIITSSSSSSSSSSSFTKIIGTLFVMACISISFYLGTLSGMHVACRSNPITQKEERESSFSLVGNNNNNDYVHKKEMEKIVQQRIRQAMDSQTIKKQVMEKQREQREHEEERERKLFKPNDYVDAHASGGGLLPDIESKANKKKNNNNIKILPVDKVQQPQLPAAIQSNMKRLKKKVPRFDHSMSSYAVGMSKINKNDFLNTFDYGLPPDHDAALGKGNTGSDEVLLLYSHRNAIPSSISADTTNAILYESDNEENGSSSIPMLTPTEATSNCDAMNVIQTRAFGGMKQCIAIVGGYESYHVQRWMRSGEIDKSGGRRRVGPGSGGTGTQRIDPNVPLRHVSRGMQANGVDQFHPPKARSIHNHWIMLRSYLNNVDSVMDKLQPIAQRVAKQNTIIVMVCNLGQSSLLMNFICSCKSRGFDLSNLLVFATDVDTLRIVNALGITAFHDDTLFESMPTEEAGMYGDKAFTKMMYAKVLAVQLINSLGFHILYQDVDIIWHKNPLSVFLDTKHPFSKFDVLFQDDGARSVRYTPYSANSGFYFVRNNELTNYLFVSLLYNGDLINETHSHQQALSSLLVEHSSLYGLNVKTLYGQDFPGGFHYHRYNQRYYLKDVAVGNKVPFIFHMSWTSNKDDKLKFMKQMGMWYLQEECVNDDMQETLQFVTKDGNDDYFGGKEDDEFVSTCCSAKPLITCFYRDKPSSIDCSDSPPIDKNGRSFWKSTM